MQPNNNHDITKMNSEAGSFPHTPSHPTDTEVKVTGC
jgi:hypothetical protein